MASNRSSSTPDSKPVFKNTNRPTSITRLSAALQQQVTSFSTDEEKFLLSRAHPAFYAGGEKARRAILAQKVLHNLAHRIRVKKMLAFIKAHPDVLSDVYPYKLILIDRCGRKITRPNIISALVALDELNITTPKAEKELRGDDALIPALLGMFDQPAQQTIRAQLLEQRNKASSDEHKAATEKRTNAYMQAIHEFVQTIIESKAISNDANYDRKAFEAQLNSEPVQKFRQAIADVTTGDNGELGVLFDPWKLGELYMHKLQTVYTDQKDSKKEDALATLGNLCSNKTNLVHAAVYLVLQHFGQYHHLEVFKAGANRIAKGEKRPVRFDCSNGLPADLKGIGFDSFFGLYFGYKYGGRRGGIGPIVCWIEDEPRCHPFFKTLAEQRQQSLLMQQPTEQHKNHCSIM